MKIAYVDETGTDGKSPVLVMVGVVADTSRLSRTQEEFEALFDELGDLATKTLTELKSTEIYRGRRSWRGVDGDERHSVISGLCSWVGQRKHHLTLAAIDFQRWGKHGDGRMEDEWLAAALHTALQIQRANQGIKKRKGVTFLVFDEQKQKSDALAELLFDPPAWTHEYYGRSKNQVPLDQVLDTAFYAKSHHSGLVQVADLFAFVFRRHVEIVDYGAAEDYEGEADRIRSWVEVLSDRLVDRVHRWPSKPKNEAAQWFNEMAPRSLLDI